MKKNLTEEQISMVNGGMIVKVEDSEIRYVVDDWDGTILGMARNGLALLLAGRLGVSLQTITPEWYKSRFGREFNPDNYSGLPINLGK